MSSLRLSITKVLHVSVLTLPLFLFLFAPQPIFAEASGDAVGADLRQLQKLGPVTVQTIVANGIRALLGVAGAIALLMFVYGGFLWMTAAGNDERIKKGKNTLLWASIGIVAMFLSYAGVRFVFSVINMEATPAQSCINKNNPDGSIEIICKGDPNYPKK